MIKGIAIASQDPELEKAFADLSDEAKNFEQRAKFIQRQADAVSKEANVRKRAVWDRIEGRLKEKGQLPSSFDASKHHLHYEEGTGLIAMCDGDHDSVGSKIAQLLHSLE